MSLRMPSTRTAMVQGTPATRTALSGRHQGLQVSTHRVALRSSKAYVRTARPARPARQVIYAAQSMEDQEKAFVEAERRWQENVRQGKVKAMSAAEMVPLIESDEWTVLDVRPQEEVEKGALKGSVNIPLFVVDTSLSPDVLVKQAAAFGMGGWWQGNKHMVPNEAFQAEVQAAIPRGSKVVVACQKGLRSLAASEQLCKLGYDNIAWLNGGFAQAPKGVIPENMVDGDDVRLAGVGGLSGLLGWSPLQMEGKSVLDGSAGTLLKIVAAFLVFDLLLLAFELKDQPPQ